MKRYTARFFIGVSYLIFFLFVSIGVRAQYASPVGSFGVPADTLKSCPTTGAQLHDETFSSQVLGETRHYRIFLPANYDSVDTRYPVIYYLHGHSDRYTLQDYEQGHDTVPKICRFVATHPVIVVAVDGFIKA